MGSLGWLFLVENLLRIVPGLGDQVEKYGINGASNGLGNLETQNTGEVLGQVGGGLLLAAYALAFLVAGLLVLRRRDITS